MNKKIIKDDEFFMRSAIGMAKKSAAMGEVPVGAVIIMNGNIISSAHNMRETGKNALLHAEITAIERACERLERWRLEGCTLYVTLEPCPMCAGAVINSRLDRVVFASYDKKAGALGSVLDISTFGFNHKFTYTGGVLEEECSQMLSGFFRKLRGKE